MTTSPATQRASGIPSARSPNIKSQHQQQSPGPAVPLQHRKRNGDSHDDFDEEKKQDSPVHSSSNTESTITIQTATTQATTVDETIATSSSALFDGTATDHEKSVAIIPTAEVDWNADPALLPPLSSMDALALRRDGAERTLQRLRQALDLAVAREQAAKTALAKSDAVILELRSTIRQLKRQIETAAAVASNGGGGGASVTSSAEPQQHHHQQQQQSSAVQAEELRLELDKAHAQILTADMVRRELEDTLEAEQYTWELRVQDQERTIQQLQQECAVLQADLQESRTQWKEAEEGWNAELQDLQVKLQAAAVGKSKETGDSAELQRKLNMLEAERKELQACLDEALKELEAVDAELQRDGTVQLRQENQRLQALLQETDVTEPLQQLYAWLLEQDARQQPDLDQLHQHKPKELLRAVRLHLQEQTSRNKDLAETQRQVVELESQLSVYKGDLKAREESSAELRASLKEAVALLKPLQDAVAKADREKTRLQEKVDRLQHLVTGNTNDAQVEVKKLKRIMEEKENEIDSLHEQIESLELQLSRAKLAVANNLITAQRSSAPDAAADQENLHSKREQLKAKRDNTLQNLLKDTYGRLDSLHSKSSHEDTLRNELASKEAKMVELESEVNVLREEMNKKDLEVRALTKELQQAQSLARRPEDEQLRELHTKLQAAQQELKEKKEVEKALNNSLKDAIALLKPLQLHLEDAEQEKRDMARELHALKQRMSDPAGRSASDMSRIKDLEKTITDLERENSRLHDALEDMSQSFNASILSGVSKSESRLREELVEMKSRYEVTKSRLEHQYEENQGLLDRLRSREKEERVMLEDLQILREKIKSQEAELGNAKYIATTALMKVEEMTLDKDKANIEARYREKAKEVDDEVKSSRPIHASYRLS